MPAFAGMTICWVAMPKEIYVEFIILGNTVKATAIDPETGVEASVIGPANAAQSIMAQAARRKLEYVQKKK
jgi:hypothetical protein